jgi:release factor glutamine methyltransferase
VATRKQLLENAGKLLENASVPAGRREIEWLLQEADSCKRIDLVAEADAPVDEEAEKRFFSFVSRRLAREPVQYILGYTEFFGVRLRVDPSVLIPRPETELLVEFALSSLKDMSNSIVLDVGTGSGCIAIALKKGLPDTTVVGIDVSPKALGLARLNASDVGVDVEWIEADMHDPDLVVDLTRRFGLASVDIIVSNPPYVPPGDRISLEPEVVRFEPEIALFTGDDIAEPYRALGNLGLEVLSESGFLVLEIHADHAKEIRDTLRKVGYHSIDIFQDLAGRDRMIVARLRGK